MARYPGARWRPVERYLPGGPSAVPMTRYDGGVDHTYVGSPSHDAAFAGFNRSGTPTPHFMFFLDGSVVQYIDTQFRSSACLDGNPRLVTWETEDGFPSQWSDGQAPKDNPKVVQSKAKLMAWLHTEHGIPLVRMPSSRPTDRGFGWHRLGIDGNFEQPAGQLLGGRVSGGEHWSTSFGKTCPTSRRIHQFVEETLPAAVALANPKKPKPTPPPEDTFDVSILSGRFDRSDKAVSAAWEGERKHGASLLLGTELAGRTDDTIGGDPHYGVLHSDAGGPKSENAVEYAKADWNLEDSKLAKVWDGGGTGRFENPADARITVLRSKGNGRELVDIQNHEAAHLFKGSKFFRPGNLARWLKIRNREAYIMRALRVEHPDAAFMLSGDPNASGTFLERYMATHFAGFKAANNFRFGAAWVSGLRRVGPVESVPTPSSDHPIQRVRLAWAKPKKKK